MKRRTAVPVSIDPLARAAEQQHWLKPEAEVAVQRAIRSSFNIFGANALAVRSTLHGDWLHEPLHAIMTDIPVGAWTATVLFDSISAASKSKKLDTAADATNLLGLAGAVGAAVTGMNDWASIERPAPRRIGAVHALLNIGATGLFAWSALARKNNRALGRSLAVAGFVLVSASAHLGGNLVYEHGVGVRKPKRGRRDAGPVKEVEFEETTLDLPPEPPASPQPRTRRRKVQARNG